MKEKVLSLFLTKQLSCKQIARKLDIQEEDVKTYLLEEHYLPGQGRSFDSVIRTKQAVDLFLSDEAMSATKAAKAFNLNPTSFCLNLKQMGIIAENKQNKTKFNENVFDIIDSEEKAYWLGFIYADGSIDSSPLIKEKKSRYQFELSLSEIDHEHLDKFNSFMQHSKNNVITGNVVLNGKTFKRCRWIINNKHLWHTLNKLGCTPNKSLTLRFPNLSEDLKRHFIRGYFDGDGSLGIYDDKLQCSCLGTLNMLDNILSDLNINLKYHHDKRHSEFTYSFQLTSEKGMNFLNYLYKDCTIYLQRKYNKYLDICRLWEKSHRLSSGNIGEGCDADTEITSEIS